MASGAKHHCVVGLVHRITPSIPHLYTLVSEGIRLKGDAEVNRDAINNECSGKDSRTLGTKLSHRLTFRTRWNFIWCCTKPR